jgi:hypothetical protein
MFAPDGRKICGLLSPPPMPHSLPPQLAKAKATCDCSQTTINRQVCGVRQPNPGNNNWTKIPYNPNSNAKSIPTVRITLPPPPPPLIPCIRITPPYVSGVSGVSVVPVVPVVPSFPFIGKNILRKPILKSKKCSLTPMLSTIYEEDDSSIHYLTPANKINGKIYPLMVLELPLGESNESILARFSKFNPIGLQNRGSDITGTYVDVLFDIKEFREMARNNLKNTLTLLFRRD